MKVGTLLRRATIVLLVLTALKILVEGAELVRDVIRYREESRNVQEQYDRLAEAVARRFAADRNLPNVWRPDINVTPAGPDLKIEGAYLEFQSASGPIEQGSEYAALISDYQPGAYRLATAPNAYVVIQALKTGAEDFLADRIEGHVVETEIQGNADGLSIKPTYIYSGDLGPIYDIPYYSYNTQQVEQMTLIPGVTQHTNDSIAFLRSLDVLQNLAGARFLQLGNTTISTYANPEVGGDYRRVILRITVKDALAEEYREIPTFFRELVAPGENEASGPEPF